MSALLGSDYIFVLMTSRFEYVMAITLCLGMLHFLRLKGIEAWLTRLFVFCFSFSGLFCFGACLQASKDHQGADSDVVPPGCLNQARVQADPFPWYN